ncbi:MAG: tetratricopeptide repeat protein [Desulfomonile tiedjei]|uniref:Tetratricopeptide repeat protein n=1 Tax=Desulfomonile tiedjei TaxID=2358 RepID=A0A9D6Z6S5_9BACT|nr:tetratricopeptide repeat protein [Desulfomonile tiedjei]
MIETNSTNEEFSLVAKGREFLDQGDISSAVKCYEKAFDPEAMDETEARSMLIEARSHLSRKHFLEALESFEEALLMGTDVQRRQALDAILNIAEIRSRVGTLTEQLGIMLEEIATQWPIVRESIVFVSEDENVVLLSRDAVDKIPGHLAKASRISRLPQHLADRELPIDADRCVPYADEEDLRFIVELARALASYKEPEDL